MRSLFLLLLFLPLQGWAQYGDGAEEKNLHGIPRHFVGATVQLSQPAGRYGSGPLNEKVGPDESNYAFADIGPQGTLEGAYFFSKHLGLGGQLGLFANGLSEAAVERALEDLSGTGVTPIGQLGHYNHRYLALSPYLSWPMDWFSLDFYPLLGFVATKFTGGSADFISGNSGLRLLTQDASGSGLLIGGGLGVRFDSGEYSAFFLRAQHLRSQISMEPENGGETLPDLKMRTFSLGLGLAFQLRGQKGR